MPRIGFAAIDFLRTDFASEFREVRTQIFHTAFKVLIISIFGFCPAYFAVCHQTGVGQHIEFFLIAYIFHPLRYLHTEYIRLVADPESFSAKIVSLFKRSHVVWMIHIDVSIHRQNALYRPLPSNQTRFYFPGYGGPTTAQRCRCP